MATEQVLVPFAEKAFDGPELLEPLPKMLMGMMVNRVIFLAGALKPANQP